MVPCKMQMTISLSDNQKGVKVAASGFSLIIMLEQTWS